MEELILKERETREKIVEIINKSGLPAFILKPALKDLFEQVTILEQQQYEKARQTTQKEEVKKGQ